jgi:dTDP-4-amino-4,6-dideoxygalactose transaminase
MIGNNSIGNIPFLDLTSPHAEMRDELMQVVSKALSNAGFIGGPMVEAFEEEFARYCGTRHCVGVGSGTDAPRFALMAAGVGPGDIVLTVAHTFIATTEAISQTGARPDFVDIDEATYNIDPTKVREYIDTRCDWDPARKILLNSSTGERVRAIVPVHIYGQVADMDAILDIAEEYGLIVVEDSAQAHGAQYFSKREGRWRTAGSMAMAGSFSFYPGKNLGACGEAGAVVTDDAELAAKIRVIRDHGQRKKYYHEIEGYNGRLDAIQAGFLSVKLKRLPKWTEQRREAAARYNTLLSNTGAILPYEAADTSKAVYHLYVIRVPNRDELMKGLGEAGIGSGIHYPIPLHLQDAYRGRGYKKGDLPVTEQVAREIVSLPMFPQLTVEQQERVATEVRKLMAKDKASAAAAA